MRHPTRSVRGLAVGMIVLPLLLTIGCKSAGHAGVDKCADIPPGAIPRPAGTYNCQWQHAQIDRAHLEDWVIYENEWYLGGKELGQGGLIQVIRLAQHIDETPYKIVIEPHFDTERNTWDRDLNNQRAAYIIELLTSNGVADAGDRVQLGHSRAEGLYGEEAVRIGSQRLQGANTSSSGASQFGGQFGGIGSPTQSAGGFGGFMTTGGY